jgi:YVTN family beta-propeller protein
MRICRTRNFYILIPAIVGSEPVALLFNPSNTDVYVGNVVFNSVSILDSEKNTVAGTVDINSLPLALEFNPSNKAVYVAGTLTGVDGLISVIE